jgi:hypothetical protein
MSKVVFAAIVVSALGGCATTDGLVSGSSTANSKFDRSARAANPGAMPMQTQVSLQQKKQISRQQRAYSPPVRISGHPIVLGVSF